MEAKWLIKQLVEQATTVACGPPRLFTVPLEYTTASKGPRTSGLQGDQQEKYPRENAQKPKEQWRRQPLYSGEGVGNNHSYIQLKLNMIELRANYKDKYSDIKCREGVEKTMEQLSTFGVVWNSKKECQGKNPYKQLRLKI